MNSPSISNTVLKARPLSLHKLAQWSRTYRFEGTVLLSLLVLNLLWFLLFVGPAYRFKNSSEASIQSNRSRVSQLLQYRKAQSELDRLGGAFLNQQELARLADRLPAIAQRHGLTLPGVSYETEKQKEGGLRKIALNFTLSGGYSGMRKFIHEVEGLKHFLYIEGMILETSTQKPGRLELRLKMVAALS